MTPIPLAETASFRAVARRTVLVRWALGLALLGLLAAAVLAPRGGSQTERFLPPDTSGIVVLDLSASISTDTYARIGASLRELTASGGRYGLVVFSDTAYEAIPPGTPSEALRPLVRYFTLQPARTEGFLPTFPANPWANSFSAGTKISAGLELARGVIIDEAPAEKPAVLLISDLEDDPSDVPKVTSIALAYRREGIPLDIVALNPSPGDEQLYRRLVRGWGSYTPAKLRGERTESASRGSFPFGLAAIALAVALLLAAYELWSARLTWASRPRAEGAA
jgi:hypothetical protein